jgi:hypothetical protein
MKKVGACLLKINHNALDTYLWTSNQRARARDRYIIDRICMPLSSIYDQFSPQVTQQIFQRIRK